MRLSELYGVEVRTQSGESLGRVREVHCDGGRVTQLGVGAGSLIERVTGGGKARRVDWDRVVKAGRSGIVVRD